MPSYGVAVFLITLARLVAYAINDRDRWRRFLLLVVLVLALAAARWVFADGGAHVLLHDFRQP
jgi:uncharacterized membrane protein YqjE